MALKRGVFLVEGFLRNQNQGGKGVIIVFLLTANYPRSFK